MGQFKENKMILTEKLSEISTWIITDLKDINESVISLEAQRTSLLATLEDQIQKGANMYAELTDDEKEIIQIQRPDVVELFNNINL